MQCKGKNQTHTKPITCNFVCPDTETSNTTCSHALFPERPCSPSHNHPKMSHTFALIHAKHMGDGTLIGAAETELGSEGSVNNAVTEGKYGEEGERQWTGTMNGGGISKGSPQVSPPSPSFAPSSFNMFSVFQLALRDLKLGVGANSRDSVSSVPRWHQLWPKVPLTHEARNQKAEEDR